MRTVLLITGGTLLLWGLARLLEGRLTYYPVKGLDMDPAAYGLRFREISFASRDGTRLHGWYCFPDPVVTHRADLILFHGNAGNIGHRLAKVRPLAKLGLGVFVFDYRGFGRSEGAPGDRGILEDGAAAVRAFREAAGSPSRPLGFYGESIGCLPAVRLAAADGGVSFLILEGSFPGKRAVVARTPPLWPFLPAVSGTLDMRGFAGKVRCPALVLHAGGDEIIPLDLGRRVFEILGGSRGKEFYEVPRGGHNDCFEADPEFSSRIGRFLDRALAQTRS